MKFMQKGQSIKVSHAYINKKYLCKTAIVKISVSHLHQGTTLRNTSLTENIVLIQF